MINVDVRHIFRDDALCLAIQFRASLLVERTSRFLDDLVQFGVSIVGAIREWNRGRMEEKGENEIGLFGSGQPGVGEHFVFTGP